MIDYATNERKAWIRRLQTGARPDNWVLSPHYRPAPKLSVDDEYRQRAARRVRRGGETSGGANVPERPQGPPCRGPHVC